MSVLARLPEAIHRLSGSAAVLAAWLGGSYALGAATRLSDVDIAVLVGSVAPSSGGVSTEMGQNEELDAVDEALGSLFAPVRCSLIRLSAGGDIDPRTPRLLARSVPLVRRDGVAGGGGRGGGVAPPGAVRRDGVAAGAYWHRLYPAGVPAPEEVERGTWQSRAAFIRRMAGWAQMGMDDPLAPGPHSRRIVALRMAVRHIMLGAGAGANLGHQVIKLLGLPVPDIRQRIPTALHAAGLVSGDTAGYLQDVLGLLRDSDLWQEGGLREGDCEAVLRGAWHLQDWADSCCRALEEAAANSQIPWRRPPTLDQLLGAASASR